MLTLTGFRNGDAACVLSWPADLQETRTWAGSTVNRLLDESQVVVWHSDFSVHRQQEGQSLKGSDIYRDHRFVMNAAQRYFGN